MELEEIVNVLKDISWPAAIAVLGVLVILKIIVPLMPVLIDRLRARLPKNLVTSRHEQDIGKIKTDVGVMRTNHLHEVVDLLKDIKVGQERFDATLQSAIIENRRTQGEIKESIIWLKARQNGGR